MAILLTRDQAFAAQIPTREVEVAEWGGTVLVRSLTTSARTEIIGALVRVAEATKAYEADQAKPEDEREGLSKPTALDESILAVIFSVVDDKLQPIFTLDDYDRFLQLPYCIVQHLYNQMLLLEARVPVPPEEQKKSSGKTRLSGSNTGSRSR